jgi:hypothetical protein
MRLLIMRKNSRIVGRRIRRGYYKNKTINDITREELYPALISDLFFLMSPLEIIMTYSKHELLNIPKGYIRDYIIKFRFRKYNRLYRKHLIRKRRINIL